MGPKAIKEGASMRITRQQTGFRNTQIAGETRMELLKSGFENTPRPAAGGAPSCKGGLGAVVRRTRTRKVVKGLAMGAWGPLAVPRGTSSSVLQLAPVGA